MRKLIRFAFLIFAVVCAFRVGTIWNDKQFLSDNLIRLHVVADSNDTPDQIMKLQVKDAVTAYLNPIMEQMTSREDAQAFLASNLKNIRTIAENTLEAAGKSKTVQVSLQEEAFSSREYGAFTIPSGIYQALRIQIGEGGGQNWWCVAFPSLCVAGNAQEFEAAAVASGFDSDLTSTIEQKDGYRLRFYILDCLGKLEIFLSEQN